MEKKLYEVSSKTNKEVKTLIVRDNYRGVQSADGGSITYTQDELMKMLKRYAIVK